MMKLLKFLSVILILLNCRRLNADIFTSLGEMTKLAKNEVKVAQELEDFLNAFMKNVEKAKRIVKEFKEIADQVNQDPEKYVSNPVNSFILIKQLGKEMQKFVDTLNPFEALKQLVHDIKEKYNLPSNDDYKGAIVALHRLEDVYKLNPKDIRNGNLSQTSPSRPLTAYECFELGRIAYESTDYYHTIRWMSEALEQAEAEGDVVLIIDCLDYLSFSTAQQGNLNHAIQLSQRILDLNPNHQRAYANLQFYFREMRIQLARLRGETGENEGEVRDPLEFQNPRPESPLGKERDAYESLCRDDFKITNKKILHQLNKLTCRYINYDPFLYISPVKEELVFHDPPIWLYHDVITEKQLQHMKELAKPLLKRAIVRSPITGQFETADYRISKSGWLSDREYPELNYLTKLVTAVTNLSLDTAEEWQIANYGIGGQYDPHFDFARKTEPKDAFQSSIGNRVATWLFYLETPDVGGATVFPRIGARVAATRRAAAFWYNLFPSGDGDYRTRHAACPVLFGTKWVSNKWIHTVGQEFKRPCNLNREDSEESHIE